MNDISQLIIKLIKEDLKSNRLIEGLSHLGVNADLYILEISIVIMGLMELSDDEIDEWGLDTYHLIIMEKCKNWKSLEFLDSTAMEVYSELIMEKDFRKRGQP
jgi:hypothetical protein